MNEIIKIILYSQLIGVVLGFSLRLLANYINSLQEIGKIKRHIIKELSDNYINTYLVLPPKMPDGYNVELSPDLIAEAGISLKTIAYEGNIDKINNLNKTMLNEVIEAYNTIYQFKRFAERLQILSGSKTHKPDEKNSELKSRIAGLPQSAIFALDKMEEALLKLSKKDANKLISKSKSERGKLQLQIIQQMKGKQNNNQS